MQNVKSVEIRRSTRSHDKFTRSGGAYTRIYVFPKGETLFDNIVNRRNRPTDMYRQIVMENIPDISNKNIRWSQKAGCDCGCSPGFITKRKIADKDKPLYLVDIFIDVEFECEAV